MVQTISLLDSKELTPQNTKHTKVSTNVDFLELLMKDISNTEDKQDLTKDNTNQDTTKKDEKIDILDLLDSKVDLKELSDNKDFKFIMQNDSKFKDDFIKEVKNILESKIKQDNILMSKSDIKEFKKIDNLKDLLSFADKKGLNIQSIKFEIPKETKDHIQETLDKYDKKIKNKSSKIMDSNKENIKERADTKNILEKKQSIQIKDKNIKHNDKSTHKLAQDNSRNSKNISLENILNSDINKTTKSQKNVTTKENIQDLNKQPSLESLITKDIKKDNKNNLMQKEIKTNNIKKTENKEIDLSELISPKEDKKTTKIKDTTSQTNINLNQSAINEVKARSVQASQTIESFKNNLDEAIKNYKPPISKVDIELNPKNLGKVEVSIVQRGNNIQVHMNTDQSNVALFQNHQAEFRQALANIGFSNIDMSFNSNQDKERRQNQAKKTYKENETIEDIADIEIKASYQYA